MAEPVKMRRPRPVPDGRCQIQVVLDWRGNVKECAESGTFHVVAEPPVYLCRKHLGSGVGRLVTGGRYVVVRHA